MDGRSLSGKTLVFLVICVFFALLMLLFGTVYATVCIAVSVAALTMLSKDLSVRPLGNLAGIMAMLVMMGVASYLATLDPFLGLAVNFATVFSVVFLSMQDLSSPMHFPMLLFYTALTTLPVTVSQLPDRLFLLAVSGLFIVGLNVMVNRGSQTGTSRRATIAVCEEVRRCAREALEGGSPDVGRLEELCAEVDRSMYARLKTHFFTTPRDRRIRDLVVSLLDLGRQVCGRERSPEALRAIDGVMVLLISHERGEADAEGVIDAVESALSGDVVFRPGTVLALRDLQTDLRELGRGMEGGPYGRGIRPGLRAVSWSLREEARSDSARFTFAVRMGIMFALVAFACDFWDWEEYLVLYTMVAVIVPYLEDSWKLSMMRLSGTLAGAAVFLAALLLCGGSPYILAAVGLAAAYVYVVFDSGRYARRMMFYTLMVLVTSSLANPVGADAVEWVALTLVGIALALVANRVILPYRVSRENTELAIRSMGMARERILNIRDILEGREDCEEEAGLAIVSANVSQKMAMTAERSSDEAARRFLLRQNSLSVQCSSLYKAVRHMGPECRRLVGEVMSVDPDSDDPVPDIDTSGMEQFDAECVERAERILRSYRTNRRIMYELIVSGTLRDQPVGRRTSS